MRIDVQVDGVADLEARLTKAGKEIRRLPRAFRDIANRTHRTGDALAPRYHGATAASIATKASNLAASVHAGGPEKRSHGGGVYVVLNHYGRRWDGQTAYKWLYMALYDNADFARARLERAIDDKFREAGL